MKKIYSLVAAAMMAFSLNAQNAFLLLESSISNLPVENSETELGTIAENPEQNAANWYNAQFVNKNLGSLISVSEISGAYAAGVKTIWVNIDRVGLNDIKDAGISDAVIADLKAFVEAGGNLLLTKQACMIAHRIGRIYQPSWGNQGYNLGGDVWSINPQVGLWWTLADSRRDNSSHPIYTDLETIDSYSAIMAEGAEPTPYATFPLIGAVPRTDNNIAWLDYFRKDPANPTATLPETEGVTHYRNDDPLRLPEFESDWNVKVLGIWGHVSDFCGGVIVEMYPDGDFKGSILAIGSNAYQWGQSNDYISNVRKLTKNSLNYLTESDTQGIEEVQKNDVQCTKVIENGQIVIIKNGVRYNALGAQL